MTPKVFLQLAKQASEPVNINNKEIDKAITNLKKTRKIIENPAHWTKGEMRDTNDNGEDTFCLMGACYRADGPGELLANAVMVANSPLLDDTDAVFCGELEPAEVVDYNDAKKTKHHHIMKFLDKCIAFCGKLKATKK